MKRNVGKVTFKRSKIIDENLVGVEICYSTVKLNKPYYIGVAISELAKHHIYEFHYEVMKPVFGDDLCLLYTDTDSLLYKIHGCDNPYTKIFVADYQSFLDFSNFPQSHPLHSVSRKCVPGAFKDECNCSYIPEFVGL